MATWRARLTAFALIWLGTMSILTLIEYERSVPLLSHALRARRTFADSGDADARDRGYDLPNSVHAGDRRRMSLDLGGGACKWEPPAYDVPEGLDFHKTIVAGFPSGDKRVVYLQMEALSGWPSKDEWDFAYMGMSNHPFIKANYPHHEGIWGWGQAADQVVMVVPHIRRSMVEYHDILWDLGYATTWEEADQYRNNLYEDRPNTLEFYYEWRDARALDEARWYGWFIDYWMEGGLMRDIFTHQLTTVEHWTDLTLKPFFSRAELAYENYVSNETVVTPSYDPHCANGEISGGCEPVAVISVDHLMDSVTGPAETSAIATALMNDSRMGDYVIAEPAWPCIWTELIENKKGPRVARDRPTTVDESDYNFAPEMLEEMLDELNRLIAKYGSPEWNGMATADRLVEVLQKHRVEVQAELDEVSSGARRLSERDFLGPKERKRRRRLKLREKDESSESYAAWGQKNYFNSFFSSLEQERFEDERREMRRKRRELARHDEIKREVE
ncbi:hypothetical protein ACHAWF_006793 [Thalassiosira exigua]